MNLVQFVLAMIAILAGVMCGAFGAASLTGGLIGMSVISATALHLFVKMEIERRKKQ